MLALYHIGVISCSFRAYISTAWGAVKHARLAPCLAGMVLARFSFWLLPIIAQILASHASPAPLRVTRKGQAEEMLNLVLAAVEVT